jgi:hypothetical protein
MNYVVYFFSSMNFVIEVMLLKIENGSVRQNWLLNRWGTAEIRQVCIQYSVFDDLMVIINIWELLYKINWFRSVYIETKLQILPPFCCCAWEEYRRDSGNSHVIIFGILKSVNSYNCWWERKPAIFFGMLMMMNIANSYHPQYPRLNLQFASIS